MMNKTGYPNLTFTPANAVKRGGTKGDSGEEKTEVSLIGKGQTLLGGPEAIEQNTYVFVFFEV